MHFANLERVFIRILWVIATIIGGILLSILFKWNVIYSVVGLFILGIILHRLFCVRTTVDKILFPYV